MSSDLEQLLEMGFEKSRAELAVKKSGSLEGAINWLDRTSDTPLDELLAEQTAGEPSTAALEDNQFANSIVCNDCGKKFRNKELAGFHAEKTGHDDFAESTDEIAPLTEEEKAARLQELRERLQEKKARQAGADKEEAKRNEKIRQKSTRDAQDLKEELQKKEQVKQAELKKAERLADAQAKQRIKDKIEADKAERRRKAEEAKAAREGRAPAAPAAVATPSSSAPANPSAPRPAATEARLRLQTSNGNIMKTYPVETTLAEVAVQLQSESGVTATRFVMNFPRKTFEGADLKQTLKDAGLVPSAALIVQ